MHQVPLSLSPAPLPTFASFRPGPNGLAWSHLQSALPLTAPVYLWGPTGCGKTHLLKALAQSCQVAGRCAGWWDGASPDWAAQVSVVDFDPAWSILIFDDVDRLDAHAQQAVFALLVEAQSRGVTWAASGRVPPIDLPLRDDLRTRIGWGHIFCLEPLDDADTLGVLRQEADRRGIFLSDEVMDYLLSRMERDLGFLMRLLDRLDDFALSHHRAVTVPLLRQMMSVEGKP